jgi:SAM-dependent methyltransferase
LKLLAPAEGSAQPDDWDQHWLDYGTANARNPAQRYRRRIVVDLLGLDKGPARLLDIGSGQGDFAAEVLQRYPDVEVLGLEVSEAGVEIAKRKAPGASFVVRDLLQEGDPPPDQRGWATHAVCSEVLEHVDRPDSLLANAARYMGPGCRLVVTVPGGPMSAFDRHIGHRRHFTPAELGALLGKAGFELEIATGAGFPFFNLYRRVVIWLGESLVDDFSAQRGGSESRLRQAAMAIFGWLFYLNLPRGRRGWQTVAVARARHPDSNAGGRGGAEGGD